MQSHITAGSIVFSNEAEHQLTIVSILVGVQACHVNARCTVADMTLSEAARQFIAPPTIVLQEHWQLVKSCHPLAPHLAS